MTEAFVDPRAAGSAANLGVRGGSRSRPATSAGVGGAAQQGGKRRGATSAGGAAAVLRRTQAPSRGASAAGGLTNRSGGASARHGSPGHGSPRAADEYAAAKQRSDAGHMSVRGNSWV